MSEAGIYVLTKAILGGVSALMTGPFGSLDIPPGSIERALTSQGPGIVIELVAQGGETLGKIDTSRGGSPGADLLHPSFVPGLLATEDSRFHEHPGVDPFAIISAIAGSGEGRVRGGSTLAQQAVKNEILGNSRTLERKLLEAIISVRAVHEIGRDRILDGYLARSWFGRGAFGAVAAPLAWFDRSWDQIDVSESAMLIGLLKGPGLYDPSRNPDRARDRRDAVIGRMLSEGVITETEADEARRTQIETARSAVLETDPWAEAAVMREIRTAGLPASDRARAALTISPAWQRIAQEAVSWGAERIDGVGAAGSVPEEIIKSGDQNRIRREMARHVDASARVGRALIVSTSPVRVLIDRGFGPLETEDRVTVTGPVRIGDVFPYRRADEGVALIPTPRVNAAAVVMEARTGAILAVIGGANPDSSRFDRSASRRQVGSALKPFLWARALEAGYTYDHMMSDTRGSFMTGTGEVWSPRNYDRRETGWIPLFVALEESSNNVAARLIDQLGPEALAEIAEAAGVYPPGGMRRHLSSALGASETSLIEITAGYAALANGGMRVTPHTHELITSGDAVLVPQRPGEEPVITGRTAELVSSMLYGVTVRGTAARAFGQTPIAGKTGTTSSHRDAWFIGYTPDLVIGVWVGRDDNTPLPQRTTGSSAAAPIVARILEGAQRDGLTISPGRTGTGPSWPPALLEVSSGFTFPTEQTGGALVFEPDPEMRRRALEAGGDPFKNPQDLFDEIWSSPPPEEEVWPEEFDRLDPFSRDQESDWSGGSIFRTY
jgi:penicillin-binding protein 1A